MVFEMNISRNSTWRGITLVIMSISAFIALGISVYIPSSKTDALATVALCGDGSAPNYGFTYSMQQAHWTVNWQNYASEQTITEVDTILDRLNGDSIVQTMILIQPQDQVGNRVNCAVHFLRYMKLGLPTGEHKDNGFAFLIVVEPSRIDVHYGVGLGLPALTASELTNLNRASETTYQTTNSLDQALLTLVRGYDTVVRSKYAPLISSTPTVQAEAQAQLPSQPLSILTICGQLCMGLFLLIFILWVLPQMARKGISFNPSGFGSGRTGFPLGGSGGGSSSRGGSGSGRSGRGN